MAALLHDVDDYKVKTPREAEFSRTESLLASFAIDQKTKIAIFNTIRSVSFKGERVDTTPKMLEGKIVQDADRLEAMGAIGIARTFSYNGHKGNLMHDPGLPPRKGLTFARYKSEKSTAINHFYEKLLLLKDRMNTSQAKKIALHRHRVLEEYLKEFFAEVEGRV